MTNPLWGDYAALVHEIVVSANRVLKQETADAIQQYLASVGWESARAIVYDLCRRESIPMNILGALRNAYADRNKGSAQIADWRDRMSRDEDCLSPSEFEWFVAGLEEIFAHHMGRVAAFAPDGTLALASHNTWVASGSPQHWQPVYEHYVGNPKHINAVSRAERLMDDSLADYFRAYHDALVAYREEMAAKKVA